MAGEDSNKINDYHIDTIRRTSNFGLLIHIPMIIWFFIGYYLSFYLFDSSILFSLIVGMISAAIIYAIDRSIINSAKTKPLTIARCILGVIFAIAGAFLVDVMVFEKDINQYLSNQDKESTRLIYSQKITDKKIDVNEKRLTWLAAVNNAHTEADGSGGSRKANKKEVQSLMQQRSSIVKEFEKKRKGVVKSFNQEMKRCGFLCSEQPIIQKRDRSLNDLAMQEKKAIALIHAKIEAIQSKSTKKSPRGRGEVWEIKNTHAEKARQDYLKASKALASMEDELNTKIKSSLSDTSNENGLIAKVKALHIVAFEQTESIIFYIVFFLVFLAFELVLVLTKVFSPLTIDDKRIEHLARMQEKEMQVDEEQLIQYQKMLAEQDGVSFEV